VKLIELFERVELLALARAREHRIAQVRNRIFQVGNERALIRGRQEAAAPERRGGRRGGPVGQHAFGGCNALSES